MWVFNRGAFTQCDEWHVGKYFLRLRRTALRLITRPAGRLVAEEEFEPD